jgi:hypothetical protein
MFNGSGRLLITKIRNRECLVKTYRGTAIVESCYRVKTRESRLRRLSVEFISSVEFSNNVIIIIIYDL